MNVTQIIDVTVIALDSYATLSKLLEPFRLEFPWVQNKSIRLDTKVLSSATVILPLRDVSGAHNRRGNNRAQMRSCVSAQLCPKQQAILITDNQGEMNKWIDPMLPECSQASFGGKREKGIKGNVANLASESLICNFCEDTRD